MRLIIILSVIANSLFAATKPVQSAYFIFDNKIDLSFEISPLNEKMMKSDFQKVWKEKAHQSFVFEKNSCKAIKTDSEFIKDANNDALLLNISFVCKNKLSKSRMKILKQGLLKEFGTFEFATVNDDGEMKVQTIKDRNVRLF